MEKEKVEESISRNTVKSKMELAIALSSAEGRLKVLEKEAVELRNWMHGMSQASLNRYPETTRLLRYFKGIGASLQHDIEKTVSLACEEHGIE